MQYKYFIFFENYPLALLSKSEYQMTRCALSRAERAAARAKKIMQVLGQVFKKKNYIFQKMNSGQKRNLLFKSNLPLLPDCISMCIVHAIINIYPFQRF